MIEELSSLRDIHYPEAIGWWPLPASWYWIFFVMLLTGLICVGFFVFYRQRIVRQARSDVRMAYEAYLHHHQRRQFAAEVNAALRRYVVYVYSQSSIAAMTGERWVDFLDSVVEPPIFHAKKDRALVSAPYDPRCEFCEQELLQSVMHWLKQHPRPRRPSYREQLKQWFTGR